MGCFPTLAMDHELWVINGRHPVLWTIPFVVVWPRDKDYAHLTAAVSLMAKHRAAVDQVLKLAGEKLEDGWGIERDKLEAIGRKTEGGDPDLYFSWSLPRQSDLPHNHPERRQDRDEFIDALFAAGVGASRDELHYFWNQFCKHAQDWLIRKEKPVDMYFIKLHPTPYRANWKEILCSRFPKIWRAAGTKRDAKREWLLIESGFMDELLSLDLLAMNTKDEFCYRRVEVEYCPQWWKSVKLVECARIAKKNVYGYASSVMDSVKRALPSMLRVYGNYLAQIARPCVAHREGERYGDYQFVPFTPKGCLRPAPVVPDALPPVIPNKPPAFTPGSAAARFFVPYEQMSAVPIVQPRAKDVRKKGGDIPQSTDGTA